MNRMDKIIQKVEEKGCERMQKKAALILKGASLAGFTGTTTGVAGATAGGMIGHKVGKFVKNKKLKALLTLAGIFTGARYGGEAGYKFGRGITKARQRNKYQDILEAAHVNQQKALMDSTAMKAYADSGLAMAPFPKQQPFQYIPPELPTV